MKHGKLSPVSRLLSKTASGLAAVAIAAAFTALTSPQAGAKEETYQIDPVHSSVAFKVKHLFTFVNGRFDGVAGTIKLDPEKPENSSVDVTIEATTINTANEKRNEHLRSADFFHVEKHPLITFKSKSVKQTGEKTADVTGDLTLLGVTREVTLKTEFLGKGAGMQGEKLTGWHATTTLKRSEHGMTWGKLIDGTPLIGDEVEINLDIEAPEAKAEEAAGKSAEAK